MICLYCRGETEVTNSRERSRTPSVWRRRACKTCVAQFTTLEKPDYGTALVVRGRSGDKLYPFSRDKLFLSLYKSLGHRRSALNDATALTETVIGRLLHKKLADGAIELQNLTIATYDILKRFDKTAATLYKAYHQNQITGSR
jgi:transcriptional repressor NrdR